MTRPKKNTPPPVIEASRIREGLPFPLGATWDGLGVNFALFSANATKVELCIFDDAGEVELERIELPALSRSAKLQKRAAQVGFDWPGPLPVLDKVREELDEVLEAMADNDPVAISDEIGDLLFSVVNLARHLKVDPETALRGANGKFERRFRFIEQALRDTHRPMEDCTLEELDALWGEAKRQEKNLPSCG